VARREGGLQPPRLDPVRLDDLMPGAASDLQRQAELDGLRFADVDVPELRLTDATVYQCASAAVTAEEADLGGARLRESTFERLDIPVLRGSRADWRDVRVEGSRIGSAELYDARWAGVELVGCRVRYANLRGATLEDVAFTDCTVDELDLSNATLTRVSLRGTTLGRLDVQHATLSHVDLRGAELAGITGSSSLGGSTIDAGQLALLAPLLAADLGITVADG
jgi:uncharacterized protein YjbI with pentapeptide repeats